MVVTRLLLGLTGLGVTAYGGLRLLELGWDNLVATTVWLAAGVVLHDGVLAPAVVVLCLLGSTILPSGWRPAAAGGLLVLGAVTLTAVPVLGAFGARPDNPTLLDRDYWTGWLVFATVVLMAVVVTGIGQRRSSRRGAEGRRGSGGVRDPVDGGPARGRRSGDGEGARRR